MRSKGRLVKRAVRGRQRSFTAAAAAAAAAREREEEEEAVVFGKEGGGI